MAHFIGVDQETGIERKDGVQAVLCEACKGQLYTKDSTGKRTSCPVCKGTGEKSRRCDRIVTKENK